MNVGQRQKSANAFRLPEQHGGGSERMTLLSLIAMDDPTQRAAPRLPEVTFARRRLPGEMSWGRQRIERKVLE